MATRKKKTVKSESLQVNSACSAETTINILFEEEGVDDINWWLFERPMSPPGPKMWDSDGKEIPIETIEDLWNIVKDYRK